MSEITTENYCVNLDKLNHTVTFKGSLRLSSMEEYNPIVELLNTAIAAHPPALTLDLKNLEFLNSSGISMLSKFVINLRKQNITELVILGSQSIPWQGKSLKNLQRLMPNLTLELT
jgi:hypothetical protein